MNNVSCSPLVDHCIQCKQPRSPLVCIFCNLVGKVGSHHLLDSIYSQACNHNEGVAYLLDLCMYHRLPHRVKFHSNGYTLLGNRGNHAYSVTYNIDSCTRI